MSFNIINEDLRSIKTERALYNALFSLLKTLSFRKITVKAICEEALVCRAAFYAHFIDKYDLLKHCIKDLWSKKISDINNYREIEKEINSFVNENTRKIKNLLEDADNETYTILFDFMLSTINLTAEKHNNEDTYHKNIVLSNFYAGGMISYLLWQVNNRFPSDIPPMNKYLYQMINEFQDRKSKKNN